MMRRLGIEDIIPPPQEPSRPGGVDRPVGRRGRAVNEIAVGLECEWHTIDDAASLTALP
jgi:hypothetical protein